MGTQTTSPNAIDYTVDIANVVTALNNIKTAIDANTTAIDANTTAIDAGTTATVAAIDNQTSVLSAKLQHLINATYTITDGLSLLSASGAIVVSRQNIDILNAPAEIDGQQVHPGSRVQLIAQTNPNENGAYTYIGEDEPLTRINALLGTTLTPHRHEQDTTFTSQWHVIHKLVQAPSIIRVATTEGLSFETTTAGTAATTNTDSWPYAATQIESGSINVINTTIQIYQHDQSSAHVPLTQHDYHDYKHTMSAIVNNGYCTLLTFSVTTNVAITDGIAEVFCAHDLRLNDVVTITGWNSRPVVNPLTYELEQATQMQTIICKVTSIPTSSTFIFEITNGVDINELNPAYVYTTTVPEKTAGIGYLYSRETTVNTTQMNPRIESLINELTELVQLNAYGIQQGTITRDVTLQAVDEARYNAIKTQEALLNEPRGFKDLANEPHD